MTDQIIKEWMQEWNSIQYEKEKHSDFATLSLQNEDIFQAITHVLEENDRFRSLYTDVITLLFTFYRSSIIGLKLFTSQFIPSFIIIYLQQIHSQKQKCIALETLLRGLVEFESNCDVKPPNSFRIPNVNLPSIYHEPGGVSTSWLSESELERLNSKTIKIVNRTTLSLPDERVRAPQRLPLCAELWWVFNHYLPQLPKHGIPTFLKNISRLVSQGFASPNSHHHRQQNLTRIVLSPKILIEMVHTIYFSAYNGAITLAELVLEEALFRANYQLWSDAMIVCNAVKNYIKSSDLPVHQVELTSFKKTIITNASFRTKKLPDDIPIIESEASIAEEPGDGPSPLNKSKSKLPQILAKIKRNSVVVITEEGDIETVATPPERKKSIDATPV